MILVAHGPVPDDDNLRWLRDMAVHAGRMKQAVPFASVDAITVRDDAPAPIRDAASASCARSSPAALGKPVAS